ncbi:MAG: tRNA (adenosine(37)-N6)-dimethylallyltransferase MiaA [Hydrogenophaga sp.]|uniref:tRNA (adenosine(37)-N6)-dimethylallyltransferase MiaA n=1 Tax=Hydrogenophaga sp. TaxID=1904254 RepID=UPI002580626D|nr:tRNA (adenosine(37)-N6)-dimethylallyltransferase MiaA [Hydrogenophaga sp.]MBL0944672.1 tRNA (adenosine(37)-N6)-dimethylallyltransferase MiaA [Hydrogenophaga sp.]
MNAPAPPRCIALAGPTASGKTAAALAIAARWPVEIVSVDSALVYRGMDIGTAKPSAAERAAVPHHLIDILEPTQAYSAADFVRDATRLVGEIAARGRTALLVGGTMLYFKALLTGLDDLPAADAAVRERLEARARAEGWPALHAELQRVDPVSAARLFPNDAQRIQRALEVFEVSGRPLSAFHTGRAHDPHSPLREEHLIALEPADRAWLHARIAERFDAMLAAGFVDEVRALRARGDLHPELPAMRCVGYRQAWAALDAAPLPDAAALAELRERGIFATRQLAKRQLTWLRSLPQRRVIAADAPDALAQVMAAVAGWLGDPA